MVHAGEFPDSRPLWLIAESRLPGWLAGQPPATRAWLESMRFKAERQQLVVWPDQDGNPAGAALGLGALRSLDALELWHAAGLPERLPAGSWCIGDALSPQAATAVALGWEYGCYRYERYRSTPRAALAAQLVTPAGADLALVRRSARALALARDLINTPAEDLHPAALAAEAQALGARHGATVELIEGEALRRDYPAIHAVGRAAAVGPRLIDLRWGAAGAPRITLVGKGVCFDSGGLDLKPAAGMLLMKKDMGGAACALAVADMIMDARLPVRLRVLVPAVENAVSAAAFRPGDVIRTRKGLSVEIGNTDAEGRLVLCEALAAADAEQPTLLVDLATLTGAARVALGPDLPALFGSRETTVNELVAHGRELADPLWPMPLWSGYDEELASRVADLNNVSSGTFAGAIIGALFLRRFVDERTDWLHVDLYGWNPKDRPGRPVGAEAQSVRALYALIAARHPAG
jgi:leucyl aminopeptidase